MCGLCNLFGFGRRRNCGWWGGCGCGCGCGENLLRPANLCGARGFDGIRRADGVCGRFDGVRRDCGREFI